jgi:hypothetical protein
VRCPTVDVPPPVLLENWAVSPPLELELLPPELEPPLDVPTATAAPPEPVSPPLC